MDKKLIYSGNSADGSQLDDDGVLTARVVGGPHDGHTVTEYTYKYNCGAYEVNVECSCGERYENAMYGCWQYNHQRSERFVGAHAGELKVMQTLEYKRSPAQG